MAQKVHVTLVDHLDGNEADETISFGLDGTQYEIGHSCIEPSRQHVAEGSSV